MARKRDTETEAKIAAAATTLFCDNGYVDTTMAAIAAEAGVAVQTLYSRYNSKAAVLSAALDVAIAGDAEPLPVAERASEFFARALNEPDARKAIVTWRQGTRKILHRTHQLYGVVLAASADPEVNDVLAKNRSDRSIAHRMLAETFPTKVGFDPTCSVERAADLMYALGTEDAYLLFVVDRGWEVDEWEHWVVDTLSSQLLLPTSDRLDVPTRRP